MYFPEDDTTYETTYTLILDEHRVRLETIGKAPSPDGPINQHVVYAFDGTISKDYHPLGTPFGIIHKEKRSRALDYAAVKPILCAFRPFTSTETSLDESGPPVKVATGIIDGQQCFVISRQASEQHEVDFKVWVDPSREFSIVRVSKRYNGTLVTQYDINYERDPRYSWVPTSWKSSVWDQRSAKLKSSSRCEVTTCEINPRIAPSEFQLQFPPGTLVTDSRNSTDYIQRDNGAMRVITKAELARGATYEDFLKTESGEAASQPLRSRFNWLLLANVGIVIVVLVVLIYRRTIQAITLA